MKDTIEIGDLVRHIKIPTIIGLIIEKFKNKLTKKQNYKIIWLLQGEPEMMYLVHEEEYIRKIFRKN